MNVSAAKTAAITKGMAKTNVLMSVKVCILRTIATLMLRLCYSMNQSSCIWLEILCPAGSFFQAAIAIRLPVPVDKRSLAFSPPGYVMLPVSK
jgi:hypothetical protein